MSSFLRCSLSQTVCCYPSSPTCLRQGHKEQLASGSLEKRMRETEERFAFRSNLVLYRDFNLSPGRGTWMTDSCSVTPFKSRFTRVFCKERDTGTGMSLIPLFLLFLLFPLYSSNFSSTWLLDTEKGSLTPSFIQHQEVSSLRLHQHLTLLFE